MSKKQTMFFKIAGSPYDGSKKALQTNGFDFMNPKFPIDHEHSCLILCHIAPLSSRWNSLYKTVFPAYFCAPPYCATAG